MDSPAKSDKRMRHIVSLIFRTIWLVKSTVFFVNYLRASDVGWLEDLIFVNIMFFEIEIGVAQYFFSPTQDSFQ